MRTLYLPLVVLSSIVLVPSLSHAEAVTRFNNENWQITGQPTVASFSAGADGNSAGVTTTGIPFTQYTVGDYDGMKIQRFEIQDHHHYIVDGQVAFSLQALSTLLATLQSERDG